MPPNQMMSIFTIILMVLDEDSKCCKRCMAIIHQLGYDETLNQFNKYLHVIDIIMLECLKNDFVAGYQSTPQRIFEKVNGASHPI